MDFKPKENIDDYLFDQTNSLTYMELSEGGNWYGLFEPLTFFNLLYEYFSIAKSADNSPLKYMERIVKLGLNDKQLYYLLGKLEARITASKFDIPKMRRDTYYHLSLEDQLSLISKQDSLITHISAKRKELHRKLYVSKPLNSVSTKKSEVITPEKTSETEKLTQALPYFKLGHRLTKADLIRVLNVMYELGFADLADGGSPTKAKFMESAGLFFGVDLAKYEVDLSRALDQSVEANKQIFDRMTKKIQDLHLARQGQKGSSK